MQVSWIDPEEVAALAESLRPAAHPPVAKSVPVSRPEPAEVLVAVPPSAPAETVEVHADAVSMPNLAAFRQRLQSIREKAINAGLLNPQVPVAPVVESKESPEESVTEFQPEAVSETSAAFDTPPSLEMAPAVNGAPEPATAPPAFSSAPAPVLASEPVAQPSPPPTVAVEAGASVKDRLEAFAGWAAEQWGQGDLLIVDEYGDLLWGPPKKSGLVLSTMMAWNAAIRASAQAASGASQMLRQMLPGGETLTLIPCQTRLGLLQIALVKTQAPSDEEIIALDVTLAQVMDFPG